MKTLFIVLTLSLTGFLYGECYGGSCGAQPFYLNYQYADCTNGSCGINYNGGGFYYPPTTNYYGVPSQQQNTSTRGGLGFRLVLTNLPPQCEIYIDGAKYPVNEKTTRTFSYGYLEPDNYKYLLEIKFHDGVKEITRRKILLFRSGDTMSLDFNSLETVANVANNNYSTPSSFEKPNFPVFPPDETHADRSPTSVNIGTRSQNVLGTKKAAIKFFVPENCIILVNDKKWASKGKERLYTTEDISSAVDTIYNFEFIYVDNKNNQQTIDRKIAVRGGESHIISLFQE